MDSDVWLDFLFTAKHQTCIQLGSVELFQLCSATVKVVFKHFSETQQDQTPEEGASC